MNSLINMHKFLAFLRNIYESIACPVYDAAAVTRGRCRDEAGKKKIKTKNKCGKQVNRFWDSEWTEQKRRSELWRIIKKHELLQFNQA